MDKITLFLKESNAIEGVYDVDSLVTAKKAWIYLARQRSLKPAKVLAVHKILMKDQGLEPHERGRLRQCRIFIANHEGINWQKVPAHIADWCRLINDRKNKDWRLSHIEYEDIHPFVDGNGRTGRMFMNWHRLRLGLPVLIIKASERQKYYQWFDRN